MKFITSLNMSQNEIKNALIQGLASAPENPVVNQYYWNTTTQTLEVWDGEKWVSVGIKYVLPKASETVLGGIKVGQYLSVDENGVCSVVEASTTQKGVVRFATDDEMTAGTETGAVVTPKQVKDKLDASLAGYIPTSEKGQANGVATLGEDGKVLSSQLPSYVDDVIDSFVVGETPLAADWLSESEGGEPLTPAKGKIYVIVSTGTYYNKTYRWTGSQYIEIASSVPHASETVDGIARIATEAEVKAGTDDTTIVTPKKLATVLTGSAYKIIATNPELTPSGGVCTWAITNELHDADVTVQIKEVETNEVVFTDIILTAETITIKMNSSINIGEGKYKAIIVG